MPTDNELLAHRFLAALDLCTLVETSNGWNWILRNGTILVSGVWSVNVRVKTFSAFVISPTRIGLMNFFISEDCPGLFSVKYKNQFMAMLEKGLSVANIKYIATSSKGIHWDIVGKDYVAAKMDQAGTIFSFAKIAKGQVKIEVSKHDEMNGCYWREGNSTASIIIKYRNTHYLVCSLYFREILQTINNDVLSLKTAVTSYIGDVHALLSSYAE